MTAVFGPFQDTLRLGAGRFMAFLRANSDNPLVHVLAKPWRWTIGSSLYDAMTTKSAYHLFPPHRLISNTLFTVPLLLSLIVLYGMFVSPYPRTSRAKQLIAFFLIVELLIVPLLFTCPFRLLHFVMTVTSVATVTRMIDLYFVQPWTGVPSRNYLILLISRTAAQSKKTDSPITSKSAILTPSTKTTKTTTITCNNNNVVIEAGDPFKWDSERLINELMSPVRKITGKKSPPSTGYSWIDLLPSFLLYYAIYDGVIFFMSHYTAEEMLSAPTLEYGFMVAVVCIYVVYNIRTAILMNAIMYSALSGQKIDPLEWNVVNAKMPLFAYSPADFWVNWHTLFRYIWVDLGFNPVQRFCDTHLGSSRLGRYGALWAREVFPVLSVFLLSGIMHAYIVYALWREPIWSQIVYFMIQAIGVVISKAIEKSPIGRSIQKSYDTGSPLKKRLLLGCAVLLMGLYHLVTAPFFIHPYQKQGMWNDVRDMSAFVRYFRK
ncbi:hypothetical protein FBU30_006084 [Linnemannia zychae]|nr:hypothetical protein FBU30_006084 [Linnemannia zychae]